MRQETVEQMMTDHVFTVQPTDPLAEAYELMNRKHIRHVPVVNRDKELVGLVTHRDLVRAALFVSRDLPYGSEKELLEATSVESCMVRDPETISRDATLADAARLMLENKFGCLPVTDGMELVGILTEADFVKRILNDMESDEAAS